MIGLQPYARDRELPARAGDADLCPPAPEALAELVAEHLAPPAAGVRGARLEYARWKPGVATTAAYAVRFADGETRLVVWKRYRGAKARELARAHDPRSRAAEPTPRLAGAAFLADGRTALFAWPDDRVLRALARVVDPRRLGHLVDGTGCLAPWTVRRRPTRVELWRYKPERRAVLALDLALRDGDARARRRLVARVLPVPEAARVADARRRCFGPSAGDGAVGDGAPALAPRLVAHAAEAGVLLEEHVVGTVPAPGDLDHAELTGALLARLHGRPAPRGPADAATAARGRLAAEELGPLFAVEPGLAARFAALQGVGARGAAAAAGSGAACWIHGDLHPDQVLRTGDGGGRLLDLDALRPGTPAEDLASWVADVLAEREDASLETAAAPLLAGYAAGVRAAGGRLPGPAPRELRELAAAELVRRAAASLRRLEAGGVERAERLLARTAELAGSRTRGAR